MRLVCLYKVPDNTMHMGISAITTNSLTNCWLQYLGSGFLAVTVLVVLLNHVSVRDSLLPLGKYSFLEREEFSPA